jgi:hypothetical protein
VCFAPAGAWRCPSGRPRAQPLRTRALLDRAGFTDVRTEEVPVRFAFRNVDDYVRWVIDVAGPFAIVVRGCPRMSVTP